MEQTVQVRNTLENGMAQVIRTRESACSGDCHKCAGCGAQQETMILTVHNPIDAKAGDLAAEDFGEYGMLPSDLIERLPRVCKEFSDTRTRVEGQ